MLKQTASNVYISLIALLSSLLCVQVVLGGEVEVVAVLEVVADLLEVQVAAGLVVLEVAGVVEVAAAGSTPSAPPTGPVDMGQVLAVATVGGNNGREL
jgi:hypothetical protein